MRTDVEVMDDIVGVGASHHFSAEEIGSSLGVVIF
jgi:hypothetical protein